MPFYHLNLFFIIACRLIPSLLINNLYADPLKDAWHRCALDFRSLEAHLTVPSTPIPVEDVIWEGKKFVIPIPFAKLCRNIALAPRLKNHHKKEFLSAIEQSFRDPRLNTPVLETKGWTRWFNRLLRNEQKKRDSHEWERQTFEDSDEVNVVVHQEQKWQEMTGHYIEKKLSQFPSLTLISPSFPVTSQKLFARSDRFQWSNDGSFEVPAKATKFHLFGGFCKLCISDAIGSILASSNRSEKDTDVYLHSTLAYETNESLQIQSMANLLAESPDFSLDHALSQYRIASKSAVVVKKTLEGTRYGPSYTFTITNNRGNSVRVHILAN